MRTHEPVGPRGERTSIYPSRQPDRKKRRRELIAVLALNLLLPHRVAAQKLGKVFRIGLLGAASPTPEIRRFTTDNTLEALRERGWVEGKNFVVEERWAEGKMDRLPQLAAELVQARVDIIVAGVTDSAVAARKATAIIPIVTVLSSDPVRHGLIASYARPGGNVTGLMYEIGTTLLDKQLDLMKQAVPGLVRVAVLWNPEAPTQALWLKDMEPARRKLGIELLPLEVRSQRELEPAFQRMREGKAGALLAMPDPMLFLHRHRIAELSIQFRLPSASIMLDFAQSGGLMGYAADIPDSYRRAAAYIDKILRGAKPSELSVEQPTKFIFTINLKTARALGMSLPQPLLARADKVIE